MARKNVSIRAGLVATFSATLDATAEKIGVGFHARSQPFLQPGEDPPNVTLLIRLLGRMISNRFQALLSSDRAAFDETVNDTPPRARRDGLALEIHDQLVDIRRISDIAFGKEFTKTLVPIEGATANHPKEVHHQGEHTLECLLSPDIKKPKSKIPGVDPDLSAWAEALEPPVTALGTTLALIEVERTRVSEAVRKKTDLMAEVDSLYSHGYYILRAFLFLAGMRKAAEELPTLSRIRQRSHRRPELLERWLTRVKAATSSEDTGSEVG